MRVSGFHHAEPDGRLYALGHFPVRVQGREFDPGQGNPRAGTPREWCDKIRPALDYATAASGDERSCKCDLLTFAGGAFGHRFFICSKVLDQVKYGYFYVEKCLDNRNYPWTTESFIDD